MDPDKLWNHLSAVEFFATHRDTPDGLYRSEARLLAELLAPGLRVLDVGCAAGSFLAVLRTYQPDLDYTGVDCSALMIDAARRRFPGVRFEVAEGDRLPFQDGSFDLVICTGGTLVTILRWREVLHECWRVTGDKFLFDLRVVANGENLEDVTRSWVRLAFDGEPDQAPVAPYVIINAATFYEAMSAFQPRPAHVRGFGYHHPVSEMATTPHREVCMVQIGLTKQTIDRLPALQWDVPFPWPARQSGTGRA
ncbi:MAG: class I SAM-dependent methyltransferase [Nitrospirae bacterium]|nr:MAG: class I SAM-dependent methyltransferase [Nitrospirota bacterium]